MINFTAAAVLQESIKLFVCFIKHSFELQTFFNQKFYKKVVTPADRLSQQNIKLITNRIRDIHDLARESIDKAQE